MYTAHTHTHASKNLGFKAVSIRSSCPCDVLDCTATSPHPTIPLLSDPSFASDSPSRIRPPNLSPSTSLHLLPLSAFLCILNHLRINSPSLHRLTPPTHQGPVPPLIMPPSTLSSLLFVILLAATDSAIAQSCSNDKSTKYQDPVVADGWSYGLVANDLRNPRGIAFDDDGHLLVIDRGEGIVRFELENEGGTCVSVKDKHTIVEDDDVSSRFSPSTGFYLTYH